MRTENPQHPLLPHFEIEGMPIKKLRVAKPFFDLARNLALRKRNPGLDLAMDHLLKAQIAFTQPGEEE